MALENGRKQPKHLHQSGTWGLQKPLLQRRIKKDIMDFTQTMLLFTRQYLTAPQLQVYLVVDESHMR